MLMMAIGAFRWGMLACLWWMMGCSDWWWLIVAGPWVLPEPFCNPHSRGISCQQDLRMDANFAENMLIFDQRHFWWCQSNNYCNPWPKVALRSCSRFESRKFPSRYIYRGADVACCLFAELIGPPSFLRIPSPPPFQVRNLMVTAVTAWTVFLSHPWLRLSRALAETKRFSRVFGWHLCSGYVTN